MQEKFYKPDTFWEVYNINSRKEFDQKINLLFQFHKSLIVKPHCQAVASRHLLGFNSITQILNLKEDFQF